MSASRTILHASADRYAGQQPPATFGDWTLVDAGPFALDDKPGRLHMLVECKCGKRRYANRTEWFAGRHTSAMCKRCYRAHGKRSLGDARYTGERARPR